MRMCKKIVPKKLFSVKRKRFEKFCVQTLERTVRFNAVRQLIAGRMITALQPLPNWRNNYIRKNCIVIAV